LTGAELSLTVRDEALEFIHTFGPRDLNLALQRKACPDGTRLGATCYAVPDEDLLSLALAGKEFTQLLKVITGGGRNEVSGSLGLTFADDLSDANLEVTLRTVDVLVHFH